MNPLLLAAFAYSKKIKSDRDQQRAVAAQQAKSRITNFAFGDNGIRVLGENDKLKSNEKLYGFRIGDGDTINKYPAESAGFVDLYKNPLGDNLITKQEYNALNTGYDKIDLADSTTTTKPPLGNVVAQRSLADNKLHYMEGFKPFEKDEKVETKYVRLDKKTNKYVDLKPGEKATHTQIVKTVGNSITRETPVKIDVDKIEKEFVKYYDKDKNETTDIKEFAFKETVTEVDGVETKIGELQPFTPKKGENIEIQIFIDDKGNQTTDRKKAVKVRIDTFDFEGQLLKQGEEKDYRLVKDEEDDKTVGRTEYRMIALKPNAKGVYEESIVSEGMMVARMNAGTHKPLEYRIVNKDGTPGGFKTYNPVKALNDINAAADGDETVFSLKYSTGVKNEFSLPVMRTFSINRKVEVGDRLGKLHEEMIKNPPLVSQINSNKQMYDQVSSFIVQNLVNWYQGEAVGITEGDNVGFSKTLPRDARGAFSKAYESFPFFAKIRDFDELTQRAAGMAEQVIVDKVMKNSSAGNFNIPPVKTEVSGRTTITTQELDLKYEPIVDKIAMRVGAVKPADKIGFSIEKMIVYETNPDGSLKTVPVAGGTGKKLVASKDQPILDFVEQLDSISIGKMVGGKRLTQLDALVSMIHPFPERTKVGKVNDQIKEDIMKKFTVLASYDDVKAMNLIESFTAKNSLGVKLLMEQFYGQDFNVRQVREDNTGKKTAAFDAMTTIDSMERTYFFEDGRFIDVNSAQGAVGVTLIGGIQTGKKLLKFVPTLFKGGNVVDIVATDGNELANSLVNQSTEYDMVDPTNEGQLAARKRNNEAFENIKNVIAGTGDINSFVKQLDAKTRASLSGSDASQIIRKLAIRQYHKYMLAYQLAAAIQGGTGGRTISDQDVENIMRSLNFGFFTPAALEVATLREARTMMERIYNYNDALLSPDTNKVYAALKTRQFLKGQRRDALLGSVQKRRAFIMNKLNNLNPRKGGSATGGNTGVSDYGKQKQKELEKFIK